MKEQLKITTKEVYNILGEELPKRNDEPEAKKHRNIYAAMQWFADYSKYLVAIEETEGAASCFNLAEKLLKQGDTIVKNAVENVYIYSLGSFIQMQESKRIKQIFNESLYKIYKTQVMARGV